MPHPYRKNAAHITTEINTKSRSTSLNVRGVPSALSADGKGAAAPLTIQEVKEGAAPRRSSIASMRKSKIAEVVSMTEDPGSTRRFEQLYRIADKADLLDEWDKAVDALRKALGRAGRAVEAPGAYFGTIVARALAEHGVAVPVGTAAERAEVRALIAQSLGRQVPEQEPGIARKAVPHGNIPHG